MCVYGCSCFYRKNKKWSSTVWKAYSGKCLVDEVREFLLVNVAFTIFQEGCFKGFSSYKLVDEVFAKADIACFLFAQYKL